MGTGHSRALTIDARSLAPYPAAVHVLCGVILNIDGVLVDSEPLLCEAAIRMFAERGVRVASDDFRPFIGTGEDHFLKAVAEKYGCALTLSRDRARTGEIYGELVAGRLLLLPGARAFLTACRTRNLKIALTTSSNRVIFQTTLREMHFPPRLCDATVCGQDVRQPKPAPDIFLLAAQRMKLRTGVCLVVENSVHGVRAAKAAGARCLAVTRTFSAAEMAGADFYASDLAHVPPEALR